MGRYIGPGARAEAAEIAAEDDPRRRNWNACPIAVGALGQVLAVEHEARGLAKNIAVKVADLISDGARIGVELSPADVALVERVLAALRGPA